ncbi:unnamed protein product, partial [Rotaria sp. Silwood2]
NDIVAVRCDDGFQNGGEIGIDCGGPCIKRCNGRVCTIADHCWSGVCGVNKTCSVPTCSDNVQNGVEEGIDCGASCPLKCDYQFCTSDNQCKSSVCKHRYCRGM